MMKTVYIKFVNWSDVYAIDQEYDVHWVWLQQAISVLSSSGASHPTLERLSSAAGRCSTQTEIHEHPIALMKICGVGSYIEDFSFKPIKHECKEVVTK